MEQLPNAGNPQEHTPGKRPKHILRTVLLIPVSYTHLTLPTIYSV